MNFGIKKNENFCIISQPFVYGSPTQIGDVFYILTDDKLNFLINLLIKINF